MTRASRHAAVLGSTRTYGCCPDCQILHCQLHPKLKLMAKCMGHTLTPRLRASSGAYDGLPSGHQPRQALHHMPPSECLVSSTASGDQLLAASLWPSCLSPVSPDCIERLHQVPHPERLRPAC